ncbi:hypothetical protein FRX31_005407 [Thalictrum thalictroides]|uniref:Uncharacterized protein n=1 Tax=Thalictrum thalictroides TaxID=46969 RepID=A0A7J6X7H5_THATH|nr:hypothetical protein FRX31_005407 [Thalictrum thalictroides]
MDMDGSASVAALNDSLMSSMRQRLESFSRREPWHSYPPTIYRVPKSMRHIDVDAYEPKILSIGPYHRGKPLLEEMEKHKWRCLHDFLCLNPEVSLEMCLIEMKSLEEMARSFYSETVKLHSDDFVEMMLMDGCFIVEFLMKLNKSSLEFIFQSKETEEPMFNTMWILPPIVHDILLLENQVPFFILQRLFDLATVSDKHRYTNHSLAELAFYMFNCLVPLNKEITPMPVTSVHHLLHLFHTHLLPSLKFINNSVGDSPHHNSNHLVHTLFNTHFLPIVPSRLRHTPTPSERKAKTIPSATELQEAGVKFKKMVKKAGSFMEIEFSKGIMQIPQLYVYPNTNSFFRNLIAFEQCYPNSNTHFTAYAMFMDKFINSPKDVMLLKQHGIIQHGLGTDEELAFLFNQLGKGVNFYYSKTYLSNVYKEVKLYYSTDWHRWRASLMHDYFSNPWAFLSLVGALVLLLLTIAQTLLAFLSHHSKPSQTS